MGERKRGGETGRPAADNGNVDVFCQHHEDIDPPKGVALSADLIAAPSVQPISGIFATADAKRPISPISSRRGAGPEKRFYRLKKQRNPALLPITTRWVEFVQEGAQRPQTNHRGTARCLGD